MDRKSVREMYDGYKKMEVVGTFGKGILEMLGVFETRLRGTGT